jgi:hypothetical protein
VTPDECRTRARECRYNALRSWGKLQADFLAAADAWGKVASHLERQAALGVVITHTPSKESSGA